MTQMSGVCFLGTHTGCHVEVCICGCHGVQCCADPEHVPTAPSKPRFSRIPPNALLNVARALEFGATKRAEMGKEPIWRTVPDRKSHYTDKAERHINAFRRGELIDPESGLPHLAHAAADLLIAEEP